MDFSTVPYKDPAVKPPINEGNNKYVKIRDKNTKRVVTTSSSDE